MSEEMEALQALGEDWEKYKTTVTEKMTALEKGDVGKVKDLDHKLSKIEESVDHLSSVKDNFDKAREAEKKEREVLEARIAELEAKGDLPGDAETRRNQLLYWKHMEQWIRSQGEDDVAKIAMKELATKDVTIGTPSAGGHAMPEVISRDIEKLEYKLSDIQNEVTTVNIGTNDYKELVDIGGGSAAWSSETGTRNAQTEPLLREITPTMGENYSLMRASDWSLDDIFFNVQNWLVESAAEQFALATSQSIWDGDGTAQPTGMTNATLVTTNDQASPLRAAAAYEYTASAASPDALVATALFDVLYLLNRRYLNGAKWATNRTTMSVIRQLADTTGQFLWQPGLQAGEPSTLLGYPHFIWENMDSVGANTHPVAFGNFKKGYVRAVRTDIRITVDQVTVPGFVNFFIRRREGGIPRNNDAIKFIRTT